MNHVQRAIADKLKRNGMVMSKKISSGGLFTRPAYDSRTVYSIKDASRLATQGFKIDAYETDIALLMFNAFMFPEEHT